jgi:hypothetical protein
MHDDDRNVIRKIFQAVPHRIDPFTSANREKETLRVALKEPRRRIADVFVRKYDDYECDVLAFLKSLDAVQQHRLPRNPSELLELRSAGAGSLSAGDDYNADVAFH